MKVRSEKRTGVQTFRFLPFTSKLFESFRLVGKADSE